MRSLVSALRWIASTSFSIASAQFSISTSCWIASTSFSIASAQFSISTSCWIPRPPPPNIMRDKTHCTQTVLLKDDHGPLWFTLFVVFLEGRKILDICGPRSNQALSDSGLACFLAKLVCLEPLLHATG